MIKDIDLTPDQNRALEHAISDHLSKEGMDIDVEVTHVQDEGDCMKAFYTYESPKSGKEVHNSIYFTARILDHEVEDFEEKRFTKEGLTEKVHTLKNPSVKPKGPPEPWDRARAFDKPGTDRSVLKGYHGTKGTGKGKYFGLEYADEGDFISVIVMRDDIDPTFGSKKKDPNDEYNGINVLFFPDGKISADTYDPQSKRQWLDDKDKIIAAAKAALKDKDLPGQYDGLGGREVKRGTGKLSFDTDNHELHQDPKMHRHHSDERGKAKKYESKLTFKEFLLTEAEGFNLFTADPYGNGFDPKPVRRGEVLPTDDGDEVEFLRVSKDGKKVVVKCGGKECEMAPGKLVGKILPKGQKIDEAKKIKEPGWYVVDHMDKPVDGPMQERGAKEMADEMNAKHAEKHGKGDITPYSAEYYTDYEIRRMNEAKAAKSDAKRLADQDVEAIMKAKAEVAKARKSGDADALAKAKKKLAALTE